jgi:hypothetical protein
MGLRFSVLGFSQERVLEVRAMDGTKEVRLDVIDLLLLNQIADFPNRSGVMKIIDDDKIFFWMAYSEILDELPILNLKKQALRDRFDKLVLLGLLEKRIGKVGNMTFFRLTDRYESLRYDMLSYGGDNESVLPIGACIQIHRGCVVRYTQYQNIIITIYLKKKNIKKKNSATLPC